MYKFLSALTLTALLVSCNTQPADPSKTEVKNPAAETSKMPARGHVQGPAGRVFYDDSGQGGMPVVFVPSFGGSTLHWDAQLRYLRQNRRAIALDLRGHGQSDAPANLDYSVTSLAADIAAVVDSLRLDKFVLVGHSMGGAAAIAYAGMHPERVAGLVLAGTPGKSNPEEVKSVIASLQSDQYDNVMNRYMKSILANAKPQVDSLERAGMNRFSKETNIRIIQSIFEYDPLPSLAKYNGPKLIISSDLENRQPDALSKQVPGISNKTITGTSHWMQMDKPDDFNMILEEFLKKM